VLPAEFEDPAGPLWRAWRACLGFFRQHLEKLHILVLDVPAPQSNEPPLDSIVQTLDFQFDKGRYVRGNTLRIIRQLTLSLLAPLLFALMRYLPDLLRSSLSEAEQQRLAQWLNDYVYHAVGFWVSGFAGALALFLLLEWRANLLGWIRPTPQLLDSDQTSEFIAEQIELRQRRSFLTLFMEQILIYLALVPLLVLHLLLFVQRSLSREAGTRRKQRVHLRHVLMDLLIVFTFFFGAAQDRQANTITWSLGPMQEIGNGLIVSSAVFLAINLVRELLKLVRVLRLPSPARMQSWTLLGMCILALVALVFSLGAWLIPGFRLDRSDPVGTIALILLAHAQLALVRVWTQSRRTIILRLAEAQRLGDDLDRLLSHLLREIPRRLLVLCLWNSDEVPEKPTSFRAIEDPRDTAEELLPELKKHLPRRFAHHNSDEQMHQLALYLVVLAEGVREPSRRFEARLRGLGRNPASIWLWFQAVAPRLVAARLRYYQVPTSRGVSPPDVTIYETWRRPFIEIQTTAEKDWRAGQLPGVPAPQGNEQDQLAVRQLHQIVTLFRWWEEDAWRFQFDLLEQRKRGQFPDYTRQLVRLALFVSQSGADALLLEKQRRADESAWCATPSRNLTVSLCHQAGLFGGLLLPQVAALVQDFQRRGFLASIDPIEFPPSTLAFLAHGALAVAPLFELHEEIIERLTAAGQIDPRFLKVTAEWARYIQSRIYFVRLMGVRVEDLPEDESHKEDWEKTLLILLSSERRLELAYRAAGLLLAYFETILRGELKGFSAAQIEEELDTLSRPCSPPPTTYARQPLSIDDSLRKIEERLEELRQRAPSVRWSKLGPDSTPLQRYGRLTDDLKKRWSQLKAQRQSATRS
jgi:hypothetical protein